MDVASVVVATPAVEKQLPRARPDAPGDGVPPHEGEAHEAAPRVRLPERRLLERAERHCCPEDPFCGHVRRELAQEAAAEELSVEVERHGRPRALRLRPEKLDHRPRHLAESILQDEQAQGFARVSKRGALAGVRRSSARSDQRSAAFPGHEEGVVLPLGDRVGEEALHTLEKHAGQAALAQTELSTSPCSNA